jgi:mersacidin/lichenicidin family type 2 lantibiotic
MSNEEIIRKWKSTDATDSASVPQSGAAPANPAGDSELDDDALEKVAGGVSCPTDEWNTLGCCTGPL